MGDYFVAILEFINVLHWENKIIVSCILDKYKSDDICKKMDKAFDEVIEEFNNKYHSDHA